MKQIKGPDERMQRAQRYGESHPKSVCTCAHTGDGKRSRHVDGVVPGHGPCLECDCEKFSWKKFTPEFEAFMRQGLN